LVVLCEPFAPRSDPCRGDPGRDDTGCNKERRTALYYNHPDSMVLVARDRVEERLREAAADRRADEARAAGRRPRGPESTMRLRRTLKASFSRGQI